MLSIIIPFVNEYPQVAFTVQAVLEEINNLDAEIIVVDNYCSEISEQIISEEVCPACMSPFERFRTRDRGSAFMENQSKSIKKLRYLKYDEKLSHWQAKNLGAQQAKGGYLLFLDAHVIPSHGSISGGYQLFRSQMDFIEANPGFRNFKEGTIHLPLSYLLDQNLLKYRLEVDPSRGYYNYKFKPHKQDRNSNILEEVPAMSTCGMFIKKDLLLNTLGGWPKELGIYGGGEHFINFTLAILGRKKYVVNAGSIYHFAERRGYFFNYDDFVRNRAIATFMFAGPDKAHKFLKNCQGDPKILENIYKSIIENESCQKHREHIAKQQVIDIDAWLSEQQKAGLWDGKFSKRKYVS